MRIINGFAVLFCSTFILSSCTIYDKIFDNPVDFKANEERGIEAPTLVFYPKSQTKTQTDSIIVGSFIVFKDNHQEQFETLQLRWSLIQHSLRVNTNNVLHKDKQMNLKQIGSNSMLRKGH